MINSRLKNVTTTNSFENGKILKYLGPVSIFLAPGASIKSIFMDFIGGDGDLGLYSGAYQSDMRTMAENAINELLEQTRLLGGNAIVGYSMDFETVTKGVSTTFILTAIGTAVEVDFENDDIETKNIPYDKLNKMMCENKILSSLEQGKALEAQDWMVIIDNHNISSFNEICNIIINTFRNNSENNYKYIEEYFACFDRNKVIDILYDPERIEQTLSIIKRFKYFDPKKVLELYKNDKDGFLWELLDCEKNEYTLTDLQYMKEMYEEINNIPMKEVYTKEGTLLKKDKKYWLCSCGAENKEENYNCDHCSRDRKGLSYKANNAINKFMEQVTVLEKLLSDNF